MLKKLATSDLDKMHRTNSKTFPKLFNNVSMDDRQEKYIKTSPFTLKSVNENAYKHLVQQRR